MNKKTSWLLTFSFFLLAVAAEIAFIKDDKGQVTNLILRQDGQEIKARKIK